MRIVKGAAVALLVLLIQACENPQQKVVSTLKNEAINLHDEVMPRLGELVSLGADLKSIRDGIADTLDTTGALRLVYTEQIAALDEAHEAMMQWMEDYQPAYEEQHPIDSAVVYYEKQRTAILFVKESMEKSIQDATALIQSSDSN